MMAAHVNDPWSAPLPAGWNQAEETLDEYWAAMAKADLEGPQP